MTKASGRVRRAGLGVGVTFFLTGVVFATFAARLPTIKHDLGLTEGLLAVAFVGLNAGAIAGLQIGSVLVSRTGSRPALRLALPAFAGSLVLVALAGNLPLLTCALFVAAAANGLVDVAMVAHGVAVERRIGQPMLSRFHAMHPLGGLAGAGVGALAAWLSISTLAHFVAVAVLVAAASVLATAWLLPARSDAEPANRSGSAGAEPRETWLGGWSRRTVGFGALAFCVILAEGATLDWSAVYLRDTLGASPTIAAIGVAVYLGGITLGRLVGDDLIVRFGALRMYRAGSFVASAGFGAALLIGKPVAGLAGLALLGVGISFLLPLLLSRASAADDGGSSAATTVARVSTLGYLGSFVGPALIGSLAGPVGLTAALAVPAALVAGTACFATSVLAPASRRHDAPAANDGAIQPSGS